VAVLSPYAVVGTIDIVAVVVAVITPLVLKSREDFLHNRLIREHVMIAPQIDKPLLTGKFSEPRRDKLILRSVGDVLKLLLLMIAIRRIKLSGTNPLVEKVSDNHHLSHRFVINAILLKEFDEHIRAIVTKPAVGMKISARAYTASVAHVDVADEDPFNRISGAHASPPFFNMLQFILIKDTLVRRISGMSNGRHSSINLLLQER
jgi:hypothetical protein